MIFGQERYENYKLQNGFEEKKIQITDDNELQAALHLMYKQCPEDDRDTYNPGKVLNYVGIAGVVDRLDKTVRLACVIELRISIKCKIIALAKKKTDYVTKKKSILGFFNKQWLIRMIPI